MRGRHTRRVGADDLAATMIGEVAGGDAEAAALAQTAQVALGEEELGEASLKDSPQGATADPVTDSPARVTVRGLTVAGSGAKPLVDDVTLSLRPGEILGIAGVAGNGQGELAEALTGIRSATGSLTVDDVELLGRPTATWLRSGVVYVPEDRQRDGILPGAGITRRGGLPCRHGSACSTRPGERSRHHPPVRGDAPLCRHPARHGRAFRWALVPQFLGKNYDRESRIVG